MHATIIFYTQEGKILKCSEETIGKWISIIHRYSHSYISKELRHYNIGSGQFIFLVVLLKNDGVSQEELSSRLDIDKATTARAVKRLEEEEYVVRRVDAHDRRVYRVYVTQKALDIRPVIHNVLSKWADILASGLTQKEIDLALKLLKKISNNAALFMKDSHQQPEKHIKTK